MPISYSSLNSIKYNGGTTANRPANPTAGAVYYDTDIGGLMIYNGVSWFTFTTAINVLAPTNVVATNVGTNRPYGNGSVTLSWTASSELGGPVAAYEVLHGASVVATTSATSATITSLSSNTSYSFAVRAKNNYGSNATSSSSNSVTVSTVPDTPSAPTAIANSNTSAFIEFTKVGNTGGSAITNYVITAYQGSTAITSATVSASGYFAPQAQITGLTNGQSYTFKIKAQNANGFSSESTASNSITAGTISGLLLTAFGGGNGPFGGGSSASNASGNSGNGYNVGGYSGSYAKSTTDSGTNVNLNFGGVSQYNAPFGSGPEPKVPPGAHGYGAEHHSANNGVQGSYGGLFGNGGGNPGPYNGKYTGKRDYARGSGGAGGQWGQDGSAGQDGMAYIENYGFINNTSTFNLDAGSYVVHLVGGGQGGGGFYGGGGSSGEYKGMNLTLSSTKSVTVTIGAGGNRGIGGGNTGRTNGGSTTFTVN